MKESTAATGDSRAAQISGQAAGIYVAFFVPALFGAWAAPLCDAVGQDCNPATLEAARAAVRIGA